MFRSRSWRRTLRDFSLAVAFWLLLSQSLAWEYYVYGRHEHLPIMFHTWAVICGVWYFTIGLLTPPMFYLIEKFPIRTGNLWKRIPFYIAGYPVFALVFGCVRWAIHRPWMPETLSWGPRTLGTFIEVMYEMFADELAIYVGIVLAAHAYYYFVFSQAQERERLRMEQALTQSELQVLKNQMQPHFLFNTLQGITTLVSAQPECAEKMLLALSRVLRRSMNRGDVALIPLSEELKFSEDYLEIEKMRLGARLQVAWHIQEETRYLLLPQLVLQPLLENAIRHGVAPTRQQGWIEIASLEEHGRLKVLVKNSVFGTPKAGNGLSHENIKSRLVHLFGDDAKLTFNSMGGLAEAMLEIPAWRNSRAAIEDEKEQEAEICVS